MAPTELYGPAPCTTVTPPEFSSNRYVPDVPEAPPEPPEKPLKASSFGDRIVRVLRCPDAIRMPRGHAPVVAHACGRR
jgi:hypothetical protein